MLTVSVVVVVVVVVVLRHTPFYQHIWATQDGGRWRHFSPIVREQHAQSEKWRSVQMHLLDSGYFQMSRAYFSDGLKCNQEREQSRQITLL